MAKQHAGKVLAPFLSEAHTNQAPSWCSHCEATNALEKGLEAALGVMRTTFEPQNVGVKCEQAECVDTMRAEINSNNSGPFGNEFVEFESSFCVLARINNFERFEFFGVSGVPVLCAVACSHTRPDTQHGHSTAQIHTAQSYCIRQLDQRTREGLCKIFTCFSNSTLVVRPGIKY